MVCIQIVRLNSIGTFLASGYFLLVVFFCFLSDNIFIQKLVLSFFAWLQIYPCSLKTLQNEPLYFEGLQLCNNVKFFILLPPLSFTGPSFCSGWIRCMFPSLSYLLVSLFVMIYYVECLYFYNNLCLSAQILCDPCRLLLKSWSHLWWNSFLLPSPRILTVLYRFLFYGI